MKMKYTKPNLTVELFTMTQMIAETCGVPYQDPMYGGPNHNDKATCGWRDPYDNTVYWVEATMNCTEDTPTDTPVIEGVCYNTPDGGLSIFGSF